MSTKQRLSCLIVYHEKDAENARKLGDLLRQLGFKCKLLYEVAGTNILTEIFQLSGSSDCIISLITPTLVDCEMTLLLHTKLYYWLNGRRYVPVAMDIDDLVGFAGTPAGGFLTGCRVLQTRSRELGEQFRRDLVCAVTAAAVTSSLADGQPVNSEASTTVAGVKIRSKHLDALGIPEITSSTGNANKDQLPLTKHPLRDNIQAADTDDESSALTPKQTGNKLSSRSSCGQIVPRAISRLNWSMQNPMPTVETIKLNHKSPHQSPSAPYQEETFKRLLGRGSSSSVYLSDYKLPSGDIVKVARKELIPHENAAKHIDRERAAKNLRSPFLLPVLEVIGQQFRLFQVITPYMQNGNLEEFLNPQSKNSEPPTFIHQDTDRRMHLLTIIYQVSEAMDFLHKINFVHGDINPRNVLLDEHGNARLGDYGIALQIGKLNLHEKESDQTFLARLGYQDPYANAGEKCIAHDIYSFGITILQVLKWNPSMARVQIGETNNYRSLFERIQLDHNGHVPEVDTFSGEYVDNSLWPDDSVTRTVKSVALNCLKPVRERYESSRIKRTMKKIMINKKLSLVNYDGNRCLHCMVESPSNDLLPFSPGCPEDCQFLRICPVCLPLLSSGQFSCPMHQDSQIYPPIGGDRAYALIISGIDRDNPDTHDTFMDDCRQVTVAVCHPHILGIPRQNVYRISKDENSTAADIRRLLKEICDKRPNFFFMYYSGHNYRSNDSCELDVSDDQCDTMQMKKLAEELSPLKCCSRILMILDCCYAGSLNLLPQLEQKDGHVAWRVLWPSSGRREKSNIAQSNINSVFTKYLVAGLKGAKECPDGSSNCLACTVFRGECLKSRYVTHKSLDTFVSSHMRGRYQDGRRDEQRPIMTTEQRSQPAIAYYRNEPLYELHYESPEGDKCTCTLDSIDEDIDDVLQSLWNLLKSNLPKQLDHRALKVCQKRGKRYRELSSSNDIIDAIYEQGNSLFVTIRTDGAELDYEKWVACLCDASFAQDAIDHLSPLPENHYEFESPTGIAKLQLKTIENWHHNRDNAFHEVLMNCWDAFYKLKQQHPEDLSLFAEIHHKLSLFRIRSPYTNSSDSDSSC